MANSYLPATYQPSYGYSGAGPYMGYPMQQSGMSPMQSGMTQPGYSGGGHGLGMKWVDGEAEAKGTPIPQGESQYAMWDINEPVIYIKSLNQMGMPNPMQKAHYKIEGMEQSRRSGPVGGASGSMETENIPEDATRYVRHEDLERMRKELLEAIGGISAATGSTAGGGSTMSGAMNGGSGNMNASGTRRGTKGEAV